MAEDTIKCPVCGVDVPVERRELLGVSTCVKCTKGGRPPSANDVKLAESSTCNAWIRDKDLE